MDRARMNNSTPPAQPDCVRDGLPRPLHFAPLSRPPSAHQPAAAPVLSAQVVRTDTQGLFHKPPLTASCTSLPRGSQGLNAATSCAAQPHRSSSLTSSAGAVPKPAVPSCPGQPGASRPPPSTREVLTRQGTSGPAPGGDQPDDDDSGKRKRKRTSPEQLRVLESTFSREQHPTLGVRNQLAMQLGMTPRSVQIWFQNRRAKARNQSQVAPIPTLLLGTHPKGPQKPGGEASHADAALLSSIFHLAAAASVSSEQGDRLASAKVQSSLRSSPVSSSSLISSSSPPASSKQTQVGGGDVGESATTAVRRKPNGNLDTPASSSTSTQASAQQMRGSAMTEESALFKAAVMGRKEEVARLVQQQTRKDSPAWRLETEKALMAASSVGHVGVVECILACGACRGPPPASLAGRFTALHAASKNGHQRIAELLIEAGADVHAEEASENESPLHVAAMKGRHSVALLLLRRGALPDARDRRGYGPLHHAAVNGHQSVAELLLDHRASVDLRCHRGRTPLHAAALQGFHGIADLLLRRGAEPNVQDDASGSTPLHYAVREKRLGVVGRLLAAGCSRSLANKHGMTALHVSSLAGDETVMAALLESAVDRDLLEARDEDGCTALHHASYGGSLGIVRRLLAAGADTEARDRGGDKPVQLAARRGHVAVVKALLPSRSEISGGAAHARSSHEGSPLSPQAARSGGPATESLQHAPRNAAHHPRDLKHEDVEDEGEEGDEDEDLEEEMVIDDDEEEEGDDNEGGSDQRPLIKPPAP